MISGQGLSVWATTLVAIFVGTLGGRKSVHSRSINSDTRDKIPNLEDLSSLEIPDLEDQIPNLEDLEDKIPNLDDLSSHIPNLEDLSSHIPNLEDLSSLKSCWKGFPPSQAMAKCVLCWAGPFVGFHPALDPAVDCPAGAENATEVITLSCPAGEYNSNGMCARCAAGKFSDKSGSTQCTDAPPGSIVASEGATSSTLCKKGTAQDKPGQRECQICPKGKHAANHGQHECTECLVGWHQQSKGQGHCDPCPTGKYAPDQTNGQCYCAALGKNGKCALSWSDTSCMEACQPCLKEAQQNNYSLSWMRRKSATGYSMAKTNCGKCGCCYC